MKGKELKYGKNLLNALIRAVSTNLREIKIYDDIKFSLETLETFFENWRGRTAISIFTYRWYRGDEDYIKLINKYKNDGVIKVFD